MFLTVEWRRLKVVVSVAGQIEICDTRGTSGMESVKFMALYSVKIAMLMGRRPTKTVVQREPLVLDMAKFTAFCEVANGVMKHGSDFVWILAGRSDANVDRIRWR